MASIVLFHSALGLRPAIHRFAEALRASGHTVHTPDLYAGVVFDDLDAGVAERDRLGIPELLGRAHRAVAGLPGELVYAGFSMGAAPAQVLATSRAGARGLVLVHGALPPQQLGLVHWPADLLVQAHTTPGDPWVDSDGVAALATSVSRSQWQHYEYPRTGHLFTDEALADHDVDAASAVLARMQGFIRRLDVMAASEGVGAAAGSEPEPDAAPRRPLQMGSFD